MPDDLRRDDAGSRRRLRARNLVLLIVLLGLAALFYAMTFVKFRVGA